MTKTSDERLLPCPFCGGAAKLATSQIPREYACRIKCDGCYIEIIRTDSWYEITAKEKAVAAWNRRAPASAGEAHIKHMVDRFLSWRFPDDFNPDGGIRFDRDHNQNTPWPAKHEPTGTNLFDAQQAEAMVRHMLEGLPTAPASAGVTPEGWVLAPEVPDMAMIDAGRDRAGPRRHLSVSNVYSAMLAARPAPPVEG